MSTLAESIRGVAQPLSGEAHDYDALLRLASNADIVLLGESTHGTHEFYRERAEITKRLILDLNFGTVAVEADWPDSYRVNTYVRNIGEHEDAVESLVGFQRFPQWMWRNTDVLDFIGWLREHNDSQVLDDDRCGFYGLDLYSLHASIGAVLKYLRKVDPEAAQRAEKHYGCFNRFGQETENYSLFAGAGLGPTCEDEVVAELIQLRRKSAEYLQRDGRSAEEAYFSAEQNAVVVRDAEQYYRHMLKMTHSSWNQRDLHMMDTLIAIMEHLSRRHRDPKVVVWAHNSHIGDARATQMGTYGELNLGQLVREAYGKKAVSIGFTTYTGSVTAASTWGGPAERRHLRPALSDSYEKIFHEVDLPAFWLEFTKHPKISHRLRDSRMERAVGVLYQPRTERASHYFAADLPGQFDAVIHIDHTRAVEPLERTALWEHELDVETYPTGL
jgi:erythromycin esterase-like protein